MRNINTRARCEKRTLKKCKGVCRTYSDIQSAIDVAKIGDFSYRVSNQNIISHFELEFFDLKKVFDKIILGPKCKISVEEMKYYLISKGLLKNIDDKSILIEPSSSSYR